MSDVNNRYVIDQIAVEDEKLVLIIVDPMEWGYCVRESHAHTLKNKISDYLQFIDSGQAAEYHKDEEYKLLLQNPNNEQMQVYQTLIKDFVTMAVKQFYIVVMSSAKEELPQYNLYDYANKVDDLLLNINQCIENEDTVSLTQYHKQIDGLLDKFIYIN